MTRDVLDRYYAAFNAKDIDAMLAELDEDVAHHVNEGEIRQGKEAFRAFCGHMSDCYDEHLTEIELFASDDGNRAAAEFMVNGTYLKTDPGLPEARNQAYRLPGGAFFTLRDGKIIRVTTYYNLADWLKQVS
ncbi:ketosteroid isomerase-related protein [Pelagovum pacificum]|uniref:Isopropylmalate/homocitrate/citramalate synthase n=1 Tax=Pelagovum pacificum TaxID=2588711 RepID=A0A5C5GDU7_9RHOB|nr:ketosteroid isomerase-related protein [Pelagovum pacificum]QQA43980.1 nuclear transport factor 2 family protein [Pelagovum pacificum]TNY32893.1 isopropylmalate/homocitrate/citramalate synthase [Pelagovum pacificum]